MFISHIDYKLFLLINNYVEKSGIIDNIMIFFAEYAQYTFPLLLIMLCLTKQVNSKVATFQVILAFSLTYTINKLFKLFIYRDRPFISHVDINQLVEHTANSSFPSNHATSAFVIAMTIWFFYKRLGTACLILAIFISFSRVWVGVHYPFDVLAGATLGVLNALILQYFISKNKDKLYKFLS
ncbi:undecaprenyl-diphosphatase [Bacillus cereus]|uniref:Undecaprenyl-diphosphatase n=1 Tax=Bacillus cereus TaxID=1396 RepID=A0A9X7BEK5_BACCE|nr:undecaprenyl-diphosphatase [Bacillus cereus]PED41278.1 undecaprenyl-diphosphatase [Bacillus cereus]PFV08634.1 undecaprenyl-diphosphatase [Bacillus cereus]